MVASNSTHIDQGAIGEFAIGEFAAGSTFSSYVVPSYVLSEPVRVKINPRLAVALLASGERLVLFPEQGRRTGEWLQHYAEPVRRRIDPQHAIALMASGAFMSPTPELSTFTGGWLRWLDDPVRTEPRLKEGLHQVLAYVGADTQNAPNYDFAEETSYAKYGYAWSEPVRIKPRLKEPLQQFYTADTTPFPSGTTYSWFAGFRDPVRVKPRLKEPLQQFFSWNIYPPLEGQPTWYAPWRDPVRFKPALRIPLQQFYTSDTTPFPTGRNYSWYARLQEPVRLKPGLRAPHQRDFTIDAEWFPDTSTRLNGYNWYAEPVRFKQGLKFYLQSFLAAPERLLPTPNVTVTMTATEDNQDIALISLYTYNTSVSARVSIHEIEAIEGGAVSIEGPE